MPTPLDFSPARSRRQLRLDTLVRLRWMAVAGQTLAVTVVGFMLDYPMPLGYCLGLIALSAWLNLILKLRFPSSLRLRDPAAASLLAYDILQLAALLSLTGGLANPFAILLIAPVMVSATALGLGHTVALGALVVAAASASSCHSGRCI